LTSEPLKGEELEGIEDDVVPHEEQLGLGDLLEPMHDERH
jgi:hypothetical protein